MQERPRGPRGEKERTSLKKRRGRGVPPFFHGVLAMTVAGRHAAAGAMGLMRPGMRRRSVIVAGGAGLDGGTDERARARAHQSAHKGMAIHDGGAYGAYACADGGAGKDAVVARAAGRERETGDGGKKKGEQAAHERTPYMYGCRQASL